MAMIRPPRTAIAEARGDAASAVYTRALVTTRSAVWAAASIGNKNRIRNMSESMAQAESDAGPLELPSWKAWLSTGSAVLLAMAFIIAGVWKITDPLAASVRMVQAQVPPVLGLPAAIGFGIAETFTGVLLLVPRLRRWGAWLTALLLVAFMVYIALFYNVAERRGVQLLSLGSARRGTGLLHW